MAKTAWVDMQPAFAAHEEREAGLGLGRLGRQGVVCVDCPRDGLGWAGLGLRPVLREGEPTGGRRHLPG